MHLASIANDPAAELNAKLTWDVNVLATYKLINLAVLFAGTNAQKACINEDSRLGIPSWEFLSSKR